MKEEGLVSDLEAGRHPGPVEEMEVEVAEVKSTPNVVVDSVNWLKQNITGQRRYFFAAAAVFAIGLFFVGVAGTVLFYNIVGGDDDSYSPLPPAPPSPNNNNDDYPYDKDTMNIIFMISDGFGPSSETFARVFNGQDQLLELDEMLVGTSRTFSSSSIVTDSAAGATAYTCGQRSYNGAIGVVPHPDNQPAGGPPDGRHKPIPCGTMFEAAQSMGYATGIVVTSRVTHATPASFYSHMSFRDFEQEIAEQLVGRQYPVDVVLGGGQSQFMYRSVDNRNLTREMIDEGYHFISDASGLSGAKLPLLGLFSKGHMDYELDRRSDHSATRQPSLLEMTQKALDLLHAKGQRFFLMIEGSRIDMAAHGHDAASHYYEIEMYQQTMRAVKQFVKEKSPNTIVVSTSDHATGGISVGSGYQNYTYPAYAFYAQPLKQQTASAFKIAGDISGEAAEQGGVTPALIRTVLGRNGVPDATDEEVAHVMSGFSSSDTRFREVNVGDIISWRALVGWTTPGHTGVDVNLYNWGYRPAKLKGVLHNIDVGRIVAEEFGFLPRMAEITSQISHMDMPDYSGKKRADQYIVSHECDD